MFCNLIIVAAFVVTAAVAQELNANNIQCNTGDNYGAAQGLIYNSACPADRPYCTGSGYCSECATGKDPTCDCPPNFKCAGARFNTVRNADFCAPMPLDVIGNPCTSASECNVDLVNQNTMALQTAFFTDCVPDECLYCNGLSTDGYICTQGEVPGGGDARRYGSKDEGRACFSAYNAWNSQEYPLEPPLPTDPLEYEREQYVESSGSGSSPAPTPSNSVTPTASLSLGATPSTTPTWFENATSDAISFSFYWLTLGGFAAMLL